MRSLIQSTQYGGSGIVKLAFVGCGYVFDIYMRTLRAHPELEVCGVFDIDANRLRAVCDYYGLRSYSSYEELLQDSNVAVVVNLTNISSHFAVSRQALLAGKHVYSEKPVTTSVEETRELFAIEKVTGAKLYSAPCNLYSDTVRTIFNAVEQGEIGKPLLVYAELDDNPIHLMDFESVRSPSGASWPLREEILAGCTFEHVGYHVSWICALLGPAVSVVAYSNELIDDKTKSLPGKVGTPDFSVACLTFANGASARITCSVVAPRDHRMRVIGEKGELSSDSYRRYQADVYLEKYTKRSLTARKFRSLRERPALGRLFGIGGSRLPLVRHWKSHAVESNYSRRAGFVQRAADWVRRREAYAQDKMLGIAEMVRELSTGAERYLTSGFIMHVNELTLLISRAGTRGTAAAPTTTFQPIGPIPGSIVR
ncbi:MAG: Gfo/Idh/MocA family oxidoreductase [Gemmatimonadaceae bacterium]|nr:Gfo/Idh/MocA family oxidoreductase [Gemmatimonadaceae bacterium]MCW5825412.1 Gfo/Idh/MocA family oxidoreductase [Gemmatimonadaceae bacterium]